MKKIMLMTTLLVAGASVSFAQNSMNNNYGYGNHRNGNHMNDDYGNRGNHMNSDRGNRRHENRNGGNHMNNDYGDRRHGNRMSGSHMRSGDCCGDRNGRRGSSYYSQMPVAVQQQIQTIEQKYDTQRLAIDQKYDTKNIAFRDQYDKLYSTMDNTDMRYMNNNNLTPEQANFILQMDELDAQRNQVREERRNEIRALENQASDAMDSVTKKWLSSIK